CAGGRLKTCAPPCNGTNQAALGLWGLPMKDKDKRQSTGGSTSPQRSDSVEEFRDLLMGHEESREVVADVDAATLAAEFVKGARRYAGLTQEELGGRMGVDQPYISRIETLGRTRQGPGVATLIKIAHACNGLLELRFVPRVRS